MDVWSEGWVHAGDVGGDVAALLRTSGGALYCMSKDATGPKEANGCGAWVSSTQFEPNSKPNACGGFLRECFSLGKSIVST